MNDFWKKYYSQLVGYTITEFRGLEEGEFPAFTLTSRDGEKHFIISVSRDEEGNGGGFLFIDDAVKVGG